MPATKEHRLNLRLTQVDDGLVREAAAITGVNVTDFVTSAVVARAHDVLADRRHFELSEEHWDAFVAALDRPVRPNPKLHALLALPSRLAD